METKKKSHVTAGALVVGYGLSKFAGKVARKIIL